MIAEELKVVIRAEVASAISDLKRAQGETNKTENATKKLVSTLVKSVAGWASAAVAIRAALTVMKESVRLAGIQEQAERGLEAALIATGDASGDGAELLKAYASELQGVTTFGDEATIAAAALFTQVSGLSAEMTREALPAIQDFASAMGMDLQQAASLVGRSIGSTTNALSRYGIQIEEGLEGTDRMNAIVGQLSSKFGGFSQAVADTASGAMVQFNNALGDLKEVGGAAILDFIEPSVRGLTSFVTKITEAAQESRNLRTVLSGDASSVNEISDALDEARRLVELYTNATDIGGQYALEQHMKEVEQLELQLAVQKRVAAQEEYAAALKREQSAEAERLALEAAQAEEARALREQSNLALIAEWYGKTEEAQRKALEADLARLKSFEDQGRMTVAAIALIEQKLADMGSGDEDDIAAPYENARMALARLSAEVGTYTGAYAAQTQFEAEKHEQTMAMIEAEKEARQQLYTGMASMALDTWALLADGERQQAIAAKASGIFNAVINTHGAIMKTLDAFGGTPLGYASAAVIGAMGAVQVGAIASQPIPFERGGSFITSGPQAIMVGDGQSRHERVTVEPLSGPYSSGSRGGITININGAVGGREEVALWVQEGLRRAQARGAA